MSDGDRQNAKPADYYYHRRLPHFQGDGQPIFVTFCTRAHLELPEPARAIVLKHCPHDNGRKMELYCAVVMPDHVHLLYRPFKDASGNLYGLAEIVGSIRSVSAHRIGRLLNRSGPLWQDEFYDHVLRTDESIEETIRYICNNPVRAGICERWTDYPHTWCVFEEF